MNFQQLRSVREAVRRGFNLTSVAEALHTSQPGVSRQIRELEEELGVEIICANSPQAKGRVERANGTLQDRLVKAMRLEGIATIEAANAFLPGYMARHNQRFAKAPFDPLDVHRPLAPHDDLKAEMVWREQRTVTQALTLHYNKALFILEPPEISRPLAELIFEKMNPGP